MSNWYFETTNEDTVVSTRIRIARNISGIPFINKMNNEQAKQIIKIVEAATKVFPAMSSITCA